MKNGLDNSEPKLKKSSLIESLTTPSRLLIIGALATVAIIMSYYKEELMDLIPPPDIDKGSTIF